MTVDDNVSLGQPTAPASLTSDMRPRSTSEHVLAILLGAALALILVGLCLCFARRLLRYRNQRLQQQLPQQQGQRASRSSSLSISSSSPPLSPMIELPHHSLQQQQHHQHQHQHQLSSASSFSTTATSGVESIRPTHSSSPSSSSPSSSLHPLPTPAPTSISIPMEQPISNLSTLLPSAASPSSSSSIPWMTTTTTPSNNNNNLYNHSTTPSLESSSISGFSLVRFFSRRASQKAPVRRQSSLRAIYLHPQRARPVEDRTSQKRPLSTTSSSDGYHWTEGGGGGVGGQGSSAMKERSLDGFPIITLTSPTNSESSIPRQDDYSYSFSGQQDNTYHSTITSTTTSAATSTSSGSRPTWRVDALESLDSPPLPSRKHRSSEKGLMPESPEYQPPNPLIPQHMFLHPLATYNRPISPPPQTMAASTSPTSSSRSDFPPTYEEALDAGASSSCGRSPSEQ